MKDIQAGILRNLDSLISSLCTNPSPSDISEENPGLPLYDPLYTIRKDSKPPSKDALPNCIEALEKLKRNTLEVDSSSKNTEFPLATVMTLLFFPVNDLFSALVSIDSEMESYFYVYELKKTALFLVTAVRQLIEEASAVLPDKEVIKKCAIILEEKIDFVSVENVAYLCDDFIIRLNDGRVKAFGVKVDDILKMFTDDQNRNPSLTIEDFDKVSENLRKEEQEQLQSMKSAHTYWNQVSSSFQLLIQHIPNFISENLCGMYLDTFLTQIWRMFKVAEILNHLFANRIFDKDIKKGLMEMTEESQALCKGLYEALGDEVVGEWLRSWETKHHDLSSTIESLLIKKVSG